MCVRDVEESLSCVLLERFYLFELLRLGFEYLVDELVWTCALLETVLHEKVDRKGLH